MSPAGRLEIRTTTGAIGSAASRSATTKPSSTRQVDVEQDDGRTQPLRRLDGGVTIARLAHDLEAFTLQQHARHRPEPG